MAATPFDEAERYLLERWQDVGGLQMCIEEMERNQTRRLEEIASRFTKSKPELDRWERYPSRGAPAYDIGVGKEQWSKWTGLWVENIGIQRLWNEQEEGPCASVWIGSETHEAAACRNEIRKAAGSISPVGKGWQSPDAASDVTAVWYPLPESREDLIKMLLEGNGERFNDCISNHLLVLAKFVPVLDTAFKNAKKTR